MLGGEGEVSAVAGTRAVLGTGRWGGEGAAGSGLAFSGDALVGVVCSAVEGV